MKKKIRLYEIYTGKDADKIARVGVNPPKGYSAPLIVNKMKITNKTRTTFTLDSNDKAKLKVIVEALFKVSPFPEGRRNSQAVRFCIDYVAKKLSTGEICKE